MYLMEKVTILIQKQMLNPINIYNKTNLAGEQVLKEIMSTNAIIITTSLVYSDYGNNFVKTMLSLGGERD
jgi:dTDP-4-dehydrorhamnose reductase